MFKAHKVHYKVQSLSKSNQMAKEYLLYMC